MRLPFRSDQSGERNWCPVERIDRTQGPRGRHSGWMTSKVNRVWFVTMTSFHDDPIMGVRKLAFGFELLHDRHRDVCTFAVADSILVIMQ